MQELILYIREGINSTDKFVKVDLYKDEVVSLTAKIQDVRNVEKIFTDFTKPFTLPASKKNNKLFKHWYNPDIDGFNSNFKPDAIIELNYQPFRKGVIKLNDVKLKNGMPEFYSISFTGETVNLKTFLREEQLENLSWLDNFATNNQSSNIIGAIKNGITTTVDGVTYNKALCIPIVSHSQRFIYNSQGNFDIPTNIAWVTANTDPTRDERGIFPEDVKFAMNIPVIIQAIQERYTVANGFPKNIVFSDDFFTQNEPALANLYLWMHRRKGKAIGPGTRDIVNFSANCSGSGCSIFANPPAPWDQGNLEYYEGNLFWSPLQNDERMEFELEIVPGANYLSTSYDISILEDFDGGTINTLSQTINNQGQTSISAIFDNSDPNAYSFSLFDAFNIYSQISSENDFEFQAKIKLTWNYRDQFNQPRTAVATYSSIQTNIDLLQQFTPTQQIPKIKVITFLTGLFRMFNLTAYVDDITNDIVVKTLDKFYAESTRTFDLTSLVDSSSHQVNEALPFTDISFKYKEPKSILATEFDEINNRKYGWLNYSATATKDQKYNIELPFENMLFERLSNNGTFTNIQQGSYIDDDLNPAFGSPLLFYCERSDVSASPILFVDTFRPEEGDPVVPGTVSQINNAFVPSNANVLDNGVTAPPQNLNFGSEINSFTFTDYGGDNNSLFQNYYINYIRSVFDPRNRLFKFKAQLPLKFLLQFGLEDKILVRDREYRINSINANLQTGQSTIELINLFDLDIANAIPETTTTSTTTTTTTTSTTTTSTTTAPPIFNYTVIELDVNCNQIGNVIALQSNFEKPIGTIVSLNEQGGCWEIVQPTGTLGVVSIDQEYIDCITCQGNITTTTTTQQPLYYYIAKNCVTDALQPVYTNLVGIQIGDFIEYTYLGNQICAEIVSVDTPTNPPPSNLAFFDLSGYANCNECLGITTTTLPPTTTACITGKSDAFVFWNEFERFDNGNFELYPNKFAVMVITIGVGNESVNCNMNYGNFSLSVQGGGSMYLGHSSPPSYPVAMAPQGFAASWEGYPNGGYKEYTYYLQGNALGGAIKQYSYNLNLNQNPTGCDEYNGYAQMEVVCYDYPVVVNSNADYFEVTEHLQTETRSFQLISGLQFIRFNLDVTGVLVGAVNFCWAKLTWTLTQNGIFYQSGIIEDDHLCYNYNPPASLPYEIGLDGDNGDDGVWEVTIELQMTTNAVLNPPSYAVGSFEIFTPASNAP